MQRLVAILFAALLSLGAFSVSASAAGLGQPRTADWSQRDTAIYVVSTINLLHTRDGQPLSTVLTRRMHVAHFNVQQDLKTDGLYFIDLKRADGTLVGAFAYQMGWLKPKGVAKFGLRLGVRHCSGDLGQAYRKDGKKLIGSFTSTLPI